MAARADDAPAAARGLLIDDRYLLDQVRTEHRRDDDVRTVLWRAVDTALDRRVAVLLISGLDDGGHDDIVAAAARASRVADGRFVRVLDVGTTVLADGPVTWLATEWVEAPSLAAAVRTEPLHPQVATEVVRQCADALAAAERQGCSHRRLHPEQILVPAAELPRITGLEVAAALHPEAAPVDDAIGLGALLFAALTGRWPLPGRTTLPGLDARVARDARPRHVRAGISRDLDEITHRMLTGGYDDSRACARALSALPARRLGVDPPTAPSPSSMVVQRWAWRVVPPGLVLAIGLAGWAVGSDLGRVPTAARQTHAALPPVRAAAPGNASVRLLWHRPPVVTSFDPEGDGEENDAATGLAVDRDPTTAWTTDLYRDNPHFGGLKSGVGLLVDLGHRATVRIAELALTQPGADVEIRAGDVRPGQASDLPLVASRDRAEAKTRMTLPHPVTARFWLVWFTSLPKDGAGYRAGVAELALLG